MITQYIWNGVFSEALVNFKADPDLAWCIHRSFENAGLYPLKDPELISATNSKSDILNKVLEGEVYITDIAEAKKSDDLRDSILGHRDTMVVDCEGGQKAIVYKVALPGTEEYAAIIQSYYIGQFHAASLTL